MIDEDDAPRTAVERVKGVLESISADRHNAFVTVDPSGAIAAARAADARRRSGQTIGPLDGVSVAVKDNIDTAGLRTTRGSRLFADRVPERDAEVIARLKEAGAVIVGKTNLTELACGTTGANPWLGDTINPRQADRYPGGSSSGSAAAVAAGLVPVALGTDTACSIRQPAAMCGIVGLKPTFGRVSGDGVGVNACTLDHVGPMTSTVRDAAAVLSVIQADGWPDPTALLDTPTSALRIGVLGGEFVEACLPDVSVAFDAAVGVVEQLAADRIVGSVTGLDLGLDLSEIDDHANVLGADLFDAYGDDIRASAPGAVGSELRSWLDLCGNLEPGAYPAAIEAQRSVTTRIEATMADLDVVLCPTTRTGAGLIDDAHTESRDLRILNCSVWSVTGQPSLTIPAGHSAAGVPLGLLITGHRTRDDIVLQLGALLQQHLR